MYLPFAFENIVQKVKSFRLFLPYGLSVLSIWHNFNCVEGQTDRGMETKAKGGTAVRTDERWNEQTNGRIDGQIDGHTLSLIYGRR